jgi:hypothetical protein
LFFDWHDFLSLLPDQRITVVERMNMWRGHFRSMMIHGFCDNQDNVPMIFKNQDNPKKKLTKMGVREYLKPEIKLSSGENLFHHVYSPQFGTREVIIKLQSYLQAIFFIKVAHGELAQVMDKEAIEMVFSDPEMASLERRKKSWQPNPRVVIM